MLGKDGDRYQLRPVRLKWQRGGSSRFFDWHGWHTGTETVPVSLTSFGCMPGYRRVFGWTLHVGALKVCLGGALKGEG